MHEFKLTACAIITTMDTLIPLILAAGMATFAYSKLGRRTGYGNTQNILILVGVTFVITFLVAYTLFKYVLQF